MEIEIGTRLVKKQKKVELRRNNHHVFRIMYHFVWIPKYRHKVFSSPYREKLKLIIQKAGYDYNIEIVELGDTRRSYTHDSQIRA